MKRFLAFLLCLALMVPMMAAASAETDFAALSEQYGVDFTKPAKLIMWMVCGAVPTDMDLVMEKVNEKLQADFNTTLEVHHIGFDSEMTTKYRLLLSGAEQVDIIQGSSNFFSNFVSTGAYRALDDYLPTCAKDIWEKHSADAWQQASYQGHIYAIPSLQKMYNPYGIFYRKDLLEKYGCERIVDFDTLEAYLTKVAENEPEMLAFNTCGDEVGYIQRMMRAYCRFDIANDNQSVACVNADQQDITNAFFFAETPEFKSFCEMMKRWKDKGFWSRSVLSANVWSATNLQENLSAAGIRLIGDYEGSEYFKRCPDVEGAELDFFDWPSYVGVFHYADWMGDAVAFPACGGDLGRALVVYNALLTDPSYYMLMQYGIEGRNYVTENGMSCAHPVGCSAGRAVLFVLRQKVTEEVASDDADVNRAVLP
ncbi:MAG: extracellular solute-binding protein [Eubacteriales bacterium]|nr:extracellular solute-binding protein [Eubacteriales bacterium]